MKSVLTLAFLLAAPLALAWHDHPSPCPLDGIVEVTDGTPANTFYLDTGGDAAMRDVLVYHESNGLWHASPAGVYRDAETDGDLQRGGASPFIPNDNELCVDHLLVAPDILFF